MLTPRRILIFITIVIYLIIGVEIIKRRRELQSISSDSVPLDDVVSQAHEAAESLSYDDDDDATTAATSFQSQESYGKYRRDREPVGRRARHPCPNANHVARRTCQSRRGSARRGDGRRYLSGSIFSCR